MLCAGGPRTKKNFKILLKTLFLEQLLDLLIVYQLNTECLTQSALSVTRCRLGRLHQWQHGNHSEAGLTHCKRWLSCVNGSIQRVFEYVPEDEWVTACLSKC